MNMIIQSKSRHQSECECECVSVRVCNLHYLICRLVYHFTILFLLLFFVAVFCCVVVVACEFRIVCIWQINANAIKCFQFEMRLINATM